MAKILLELSEKQAEKLEKMAEFCGVNQQVFLRKIIDEKWLNLMSNPKNFLTSMSKKMTNRSKFFE